MDELKLSTMLGNALGTGTAVAVLLLIIAKIARGVVERWIAELAAVRAEVADHTKRDVESHRVLGERVATGQAELGKQLVENHAHVREQLVRVETKFDSALDWLDRDRPPATDPGRETARHRRVRRDPND